MTRKVSDWIKAYAEFTDKSDSPEVFHTWCCFSAIAGAAQRKLHMVNPYFEVHSNIYVLLVSPPGTGKKTTALSISKNILADVVPEVNFATESGSMEGLFNIFLNILNPVHQSLSLYSMELGTLMATNAASMVDFLTDIYDCKKNFSRATVKHGQKAIKRPWLSLATGTTPRWLGEHLGLLAVEGGLIARCLIGYSEEVITNNSWPENSPEKQKLRSYLVEDLSTIAALDGIFEFDGGREGEAFRWYDAWYLNKPEDWEKMTRTVEHPLINPEFQSRYPLIADPRTAGYFDRKHVHVLKLAMLLHLSQRDDLVLTLEDLLYAKQWLDASEPGIRLAMKAVGKNDASVETFHILSQIKAKGKMTYSQLLVENYHNLKFGKKSLDQALEELRMMGRIKQEGSVFEIVREA